MMPSTKKIYRDIIIIRTIQIFRSCDRCTSNPLTLINHKLKISFKKKNPTNKMTVILQTVDIHILFYKNPFVLYMIDHDQDQYLK